jgi:hypothetical protein
MSDFAKVHLSGRMMHGVARNDLESGSERRERYREEKIYSVNVFEVHGGYLPKLLKEFFVLAASHSYPGIDGMVYRHFSFQKYYSGSN